MISWVINIINNYKNDLQQGIYKIIKNEHGNKNGLFTIKTSKNNVTLFYTSVNQKYQALNILSKMIM
jgi:hypothetical protein